MLHAGAALLEGLGLVGVGGPGLIEVVGQLWCQDSISVCAVKVKGKHKLWSSSALLTWREFQKLPDIWQGARAGFFIS